MGSRRTFSAWFGLLVLPLLTVGACGVVSEDDGPPDGSGGEAGAGGTESPAGGTSAGGTSAGGSSSGGTPSGGGSTGGASTGGTSTGGTPALLDEPCSESGERACDATDNRLPLMCFQDTWQGASRCSALEACDPGTGLCSEIVPGCAGGYAGDQYCSGDSILECGPNLVSAELVEECEGRCVATDSMAECVPASCGDGVADAGETCDDGDADNDDDCTELCEAPACGDGFVQAGETCDDGPDNGAPGFCGIDCTGQVAEVAAGGDHTCARLDDDSVKCWGRNNSGQLGLGDVSHRGDEPSEMGDILPTIDLGTERSVVTMAAGDRHTCALLMMIRSNAGAATI